MVKKIAYIATDSGIDGTGEKHTLYASFDEDELKQIYNRDKSKNWRTLTEVIVNVDKARSEALAKLDGIDRLVLGLPNWVDEA